MEIHFWILFFCACVQAHPLIQTTDYPDEDDSNTELLMEATCAHDSKFYTPTNFQDKYIAAALECFARELNTVGQECSATETIITQQISYLGEHVSAQKSRRGDSTRCDCESWPQKPYQEFLQAMGWLENRIYLKAGRN